MTTSNAFSNQLLSTQTDSNPLTSVDRPDQLDVAVDFYTLTPLDPTQSSNSEVLALYNNAKCFGESLRYPGWIRYTVPPQYLTDTAVAYFDCVKDPLFV